MEYICRCAHPFTSFFGLQEAAAVAAGHKEALAKAEANIASEKVTQTEAEVRF